jgi:hypothetical protein
MENPFYFKVQSLFFLHIKVYVMSRHLNFFNGITTYTQLNL